MPKIIEIVKADTLVSNEPDWFERAEFDSDSELGSNYQNHDYIAFAENGDIYAIDGNSSTKQWDAILFEAKDSAALTPDRYKAIRNVAEVKPGGLTAQYETRKALIQAIETGEVQFVQPRAERSSQSASVSARSNQNPALSRYEKHPADSKPFAASNRPLQWPQASKVIIALGAGIVLVILLTALLK